MTKTKYSDEIISQTLKELSDIKYALDRSAIVAITDAKGAIVEVNDTFCSISQYPREELIGKTHQVVNSGYHPKEFFREMWSTIGAGKIWKGEIKNKAKDGSYYWVDSTIVPMLNEAEKPVQYLAIRFEITERKEVEEALRRSQEKLREKADRLQEAIQLVQTEKMSSLGQLVAGIAHEINNPVNFIYGNLIHINDYTKNLLHILHLYQQYYPESVPEIEAEIESKEFDFMMEDLPKLLESMKLGTNRIRQVVLGLRNFSRLDEAERKSVDIHEGIESTLLILQSRVKGQGKYPPIEIVKEYGNLPLIDCYAGQLNQVFMNILSNAIEALQMGSDKLGSGERKDSSNSQLPTIRIRTKLTKKGGVKIAIADNGIGMTEKVRERIFEPFFTTKPVGAGTGLGLSICYQIVVEKHQGQLICISAPGEGTEFIIQIPLTK